MVGRNGYPMHGMDTQMGTQCICRQEMSPTTLTNDACNGDACTRLLHNSQRELFELSQCTDKAVNVRASTCVSADHTWQKMEFCRERMLLHKEMVHQR